MRTRQIEAVGGVPFDTAAHLRANCALALAQLRAPEALRDIALLLYDSGRNRVGTSPKAPDVTSKPRIAAAQALVRLGDPDALIPLALRLTYPEDESPDVLQECMQAIVELKDERALELLEPYLQHPDPLLAGYAAVMIAQTRDPAAVTLLREAIDRLSGNALQAVVLALSTLRTDAAQAALQELAQNGRQAVRNAVAEMLR